MRRIVYEAAAVFAAVLVVYALTLYPDLPGGDSGELIAAVATGGVIHPPGYPLYALLGKLFLLVPHGSVAWRLNLMSAACDAGAAGLLYAAVTRWGGSRWGGLAAAGLFASAPGVWAYAICAEVFALDNLMVAALLLVAVLYAEPAGSSRAQRGESADSSTDRLLDRRFALAGALLFGLGMSNHHTVLFTGLPFAAWVLWTGRRDLVRPRPLAQLAGLFAAGLLPYAYLPIASAHHAVVSWGAEDTWAGFFTHVLRREYGTFQLAATGIAAATTAGETVSACVRDVLGAIGWWGLPLSLAGAWISACASTRARFGLVALAPPLLAIGVMAVAGNLPVSDALHRGIVARFWQQPEIYFCAWCGLGLAALEKRAPRAAVPAAAVALALLPAALRFRSMDRHTSTLVRAYGAEILRAAPPGALLLTRGDLITNSVRYLQTVEGARPDVRVVDLELLGFAWEGPRVAARHPEIVLPGARYMPGAPDGYVAKQLLDANVAREGANDGGPEAPVLVCGGLKSGDLTAESSYGFWPWGICDRVQPGKEPFDVDAWIEQSEEALPRIDFAGERHPPGSWEDVVWGDYWAVRQARATQLIDVAGADPARRRYLDVAADILTQLVHDDPAPPPQLYKQLAIALGRSGLDTAEKRARAADAWAKYLARAPADDPQLPMIRRELERLRGTQAATP